MDGLLHTQTSLYAEMNCQQDGWLGDRQLNTSKFLLWVHTIFVDNCQQFEARVPDRKQWRKQQCNQIKCLEDKITKRRQDHSQ